MSFHLPAVPNRTSERYPAFSNQSPCHGSKNSVKTLALPKIHSATRRAKKKYSTSSNSLREAQRHLTLLKSKLRTRHSNVLLPLMPATKISGNKKKEQVSEKARHLYFIREGKSPKALPVAAPGSLSAAKKSTHLAIPVLRPPIKFLSSARKCGLSEQQIAIITEFITHFEVDPFKPMPLKRATHISRGEARDFGRTNIPFSMTRTIKGEWFVHLKTKNGPFLGEGSFKRVKTSLSFTSGKLVANATGHLSEPIIREALLRDTLIGNMFSKESGLVHVISSVGYRNRLGEKKISVLMPFYNMGDLSSNLDSLSSTDQSRVARDIITGLATLHRLGIVHRDIKPQNIFLNRRKGLVSGAIGDFGTSYSKKLDLLDVHGTPIYLAPDPEPDSNPEARIALHKSGDIYSLGVVLLELYQVPLPEMLDKKITSKKYRNVLSYMAAKFKLSDPRSMERQEYTNSLLTIKSLHFEDRLKERLVNLAVDCLSLTPVNRPKAEEMASQFT